MVMICTSFNIAKSEISVSLQCINLSLCKPFHPICTDPNYASDHLHFNKALQNNGVKSCLEIHDLN